MLPFTGLRGFVGCMRGHAAPLLGISRPMQYFEWSQGALAGVYPAKSRPYPGRNFRCYSQARGPENGTVEAQRGPTNSDNGQEQLRTKQTSIPRSMMPDAVPELAEPDVSRIARHPEQGSVTCTIFDKDGNVAALSKKFKKSEFLAENKLFPRDLRKIDSSNVDVAPIIAVRPNCILINLLHIKALIRSDEVMVFDTGNTEYASKLSLFMYDLETRLKTKVVHGKVDELNQPFEFKALECILINVMAVLEGEAAQQSQRCTTVLAQLDQEIDRAKLRDLLVHSKSLTTLNQKAELIRNALDDVLDNDEDLESMYLTEKKRVAASNEKDPEYANEGHKQQQKEASTSEDSKDPIVVAKEEDSEMDTDEVEMLLESYYKQCDEVVQQTETLIKDIKSTEEVVNIILDANRNSLMVYELKISIYTLGFTVATLMPAFYGMNLKNFIEDSSVAFGLVIAMSTLAGLSMVGYSFRRLRTVQKMTTVSSARMDDVDQKVRQKLRQKLLMKRTKARGGRAGGRAGGSDRRKDMVWKWLLGK